MNDFHSDLRLEINQLVATIQLECIGKIVDTIRYPNLNEQMMQISYFGFILEQEIYKKGHVIRNSLKS